MGVFIWKVRALDRPKPRRGRNSFRGAICGFDERGDRAHFRRERRVIIPSGDGKIEAMLEDLQDISDEEALRLLAEESKKSSD